MAVELCSENCGVSTMSPRISFSHDFSQSDVIPVEQTPFRSNPSGLNSSFDFDVCVRESSEQESSSADELFSDGKMLPSEIKKKKKKAHLKETEQSPLPHLHQPQVPHTHTVRENASTSKTTKNGSLKEIKQQRPVVNNDEVDEKQNSNTNKSFWGFKRSSSCGSGGYGRSLCPLPLLSRSNSTGSAPTPSVKRMPLSKEGPNMKQNPHKHNPTRPYQKPPLKKIHGSYVHNGVRVNPVINVPSANLFGLGSIFSSNKDKTKKK
ncbi:uncharacterized protein LOC129293452 [Prosopis cineraria]|uniref:uncharacterized protein LOC129293452 n=1 Tax=Prosopis cineraria TaxID=364024 RepID=UPI0024102477|nr:uncharacterized protein LOC129293452 [Prosopis cineraria]